MTASEQDPQSLLPLSTAVFHILLSLTDRERHGYDIMQEILYRTNGQVNLGPGTLYGAIKRLRNAKVIEEIDERVDPNLNDERRRYYRLTDFGQRVVSAEAERLAHLVEQARAKQLLSDIKPLSGGID
ncbi:MAG: helix-turn-helix transcriptional regulator [Ardenticatenaceae bacterium]|nr:helix-turn-helix transcriptional regulator [Ardenticatenaceae bacterium]MCB9443575.1 helix-turn-helix transcriptional regulator [Ardenticatenaceae bacterium]